RSMAGCTSTTCIRTPWTASARSPTSGRRRSCNCPRASPPSPCDRSRSRSEPPSTREAPMHALILLALLPADAPKRDAAPADAGFERYVRPLLAEHCLGCHGPKKQRGGLRLDSRAAMLKGG